MKGQQRQLKNNPIIMYQIDLGWWDFCFFLQFQTHCYYKMQSITQQLMALKLIQNIDIHKQGNAINNYLRNVPCKRRHFSIDFDKSLSTITKVNNNPNCKTSQNIIILEANFQTKFNFNVNIFKL
jgi:hypothetical protein